MNNSIKFQKGDSVSVFKDGWFKANGTISDTHTNSCTYEQEYDVEYEEDGRHYDLICVPEKNIKKIERPYIEQVEEIVSVLTAKEQRLLKDTIIHGSWGNSTECMLQEDGTIKSVMVWGYCTNVAKEAGNFTSRQIPAIYRSIYKKLCSECNNQVGRFMSHTHNYWTAEDDTRYRHAMFVRQEMADAFDEWAQK